MLEKVLLKVIKGESSGYSFLISTKFVLYQRKHNKTLCSILKNHIRFMDDKLPDKDLTTSL